MTEKKKESGEISRREFLKDAGLLVGGTAIGSTVLLAACGDGEGATETVTATQTQTVTQTVSKFVCPIDNMEFDSLAELQVHFAAEHPGVKITVLTINGKTYALEIRDNWTLADVLRDKLLMTGTKLSCDEGWCGYCTVLVDGEAMMSCILLAVTCEGKDIQTIEGLADSITHELHPIQKAYKEHFGFQCGYCTPGAIMMTKALLDKNPNPTVEDVKDGLSGLLCDCANYPRIIESVLAAK